MRFNNFGAIILTIFCVVMVILMIIFYNTSLKERIEKIILAVFGGIIILIFALGAGLEYIPNIKTDVKIQNISGDYCCDVKEGTLIYTAGNYNYDIKKCSLTYTDDSGKQNKIVISATEYDSDKTYIEMKRYKWWFLYEDKNVLHMGLNYEDIQKNIERN